MRKVARLLGVVMVAGIVAVVAAMTFAGRDIPAPDTADLTIEHPDVPPKENAYTYFVSATNVLYWPEDSCLVAEYLNGKAANEEAVVEMVASNRKTMVLIKRGLECRSCITPEVTGFDTLLPYTSAWLQMGRILALITRHDRLAGRYADATDACISLLGFSDMIQADAEGIINYLVGTAVLHLGLMQAQDLASDKSTPLDELLRLSTCLAGLGPLAPGLVRATKVEYRVEASIVDQLRDGKYGTDEFVGLGGGRPNTLLKGRRLPAYFFQPNKTKLTFANLCRDVIGNAPLCYADMNQYDAEESLRSKPGIANLIIRPNGVGRILCAILIPSFDSLLDRKCRAECDVAATRLLVACGAYRKKEGRWPDGLQSLLPTYLAAIPADPYDGNPFRYSPSMGIVYSVGKDLKDSGGSSKMPAGEKEDSSYTRRWKAEDVVYEIEAGTEQRN